MAQFAIKLHQLNLENECFEIIICTFVHHLHSKKHKIHIFETCYVFAYYFFVLHHLYEKKVHIQKLVFEL